MLTNASVFTWCLNPPRPAFQTGKNKCPSRIVAYRVESVDCLCLSAVSASPSSANVLPCPSFCRLMNSEWVNSRQDQAGRLSMPPKTNGETEIVTQRYEVRGPTGIQSETQVSIFPSGAGPHRSLTYLCSPPSKHPTRHVFPSIHISFLQFLILSPPASRIALFSRPSVSVSSQ